MEALDVIVIGAGLAGLSAAYYLADSGMDVLVLERGNFPGSKNLTGGRLYLGAIKELMPDLLGGAPFERKVRKEAITFVSDGDSTTLSFNSSKLKDPYIESYTILRAKFDRWLGDKVMEKGVFVIPEKKVDELILKDGTVVGIRSQQEEIYSKCVILAEGVLSFLTRNLQNRPYISPNHVSSAVKETIKLGKREIERRFGLSEDEGVANLFVGDITRGVFGGGFLYSNQETVSLGLVFRIDQLQEVNGKVKPAELMEEFKRLPEIAPYIEDGETVEYGAHLLPELSIDDLPTPYGNGYMIAGDAAGFLLNMGYTVRGMDMALVSGFFAAKAAIRAKERGDFSKATLAYYDELLKKSFIYKEFSTFRESIKLLSNKRLYNEYPNLINSILFSIFKIGKDPKDKLFSTVLKTIKRESSMKEVIKDMWRMRKM